MGPHFHRTLSTRRGVSSTTIVSPRSATDPLVGKFLGLCISRRRCCGKRKKKIFTVAIDSMEKSRGRRVSSYAKGSKYRGFSWNLNRYSSETDLIASSSICLILSCLSTGVCGMPVIFPARISLTSSPGC